ncbi:hypothetical protein LP419_34560 [Massilia sp. H-1]|nr:hypothetical protein LP419_34560 [Massilia sp. H-1]
MTIPASGDYIVEYRYASLNGGGNLSFEEAMRHAIVWRDQYSGDGRLANLGHGQAHGQAQCGRPQVRDQGQQRRVESELVPYQSG